MPVGSEPAEASEPEVAVAETAAAETVLLASGPPVDNGEELSVVEPPEPSLDPPASVTEAAGVIVAVMSAKSCEAEGTTGMHI